MKQEIDVDGHWNIIVYYEIDINNIYSVLEELGNYGCSYKDQEVIYNMLIHKRNTGFTFNNTDEKISIIGIAKQTSGDQFLNTTVHELKHVQSCICNYYNISEKGEPAAYLIGYIAMEMYDFIVTIIEQYE